jgi:hypothetical protein
MSIGSKVTSGIVVALLLAGGYYAASPYISVAMIRSAVQEGDYGTFNEYVDYAALRENLKNQFKARLVKKATKGKSDVGTGLALAAFGAPLVEHMVDSFVTPEGITALLEDADAEKAKKGKVKKVETNAYTWPGTVAQGYAGGLDRFVVWVERDDVMTSMVFRRSGFATWKLTEIDLPDDVFK